MQFLAFKAPMLAGISSPVFVPDLSVDKPVAAADTVQELAYMLHDSVDHVESDTYYLLDSETKQRVSARLHIQFFQHLDRLQ